MIDLLGVLAATEAPTVPVELTALAALIGIVWWLVRRSDTADKARDDELRAARRDAEELRKETARELKEIRDLHRIEVEQLRAAAEIQRTEKHNVINQLASAKGALTLVESAAEECECDVLGPLPSLIKRILKESP